MANVFSPILHSEKDNAIYCLIGNPVDKSISHLSHNLVLQHYGIPAVYIKINVEATQLHSFFEQLRPLKFKGSVSPCL